MMTIWLQTEDSDLPVAAEALPKQSSPKQNSPNPTSPPQRSTNASETDKQKKKNKKKKKITPKIKYEKMVAVKKLKAWWSPFYNRMMAVRGNYDHYQVVLKSDWDLFVCPECGVRPPGAPTFINMKAHFDYYHVLQVWFFFFFFLTGCWCDLLLVGATMYCLRCELELSCLNCERFCRDFVRKTQRNLQGSQNKKR